MAVVLKILGDMKLQNWSLRSRPWGLLRSPEEVGSCLYGQVIGHPLHRTGKEALTSTVLGLHADCVVTRSGSEYELAEPDPDYERLFPNARQRLLARLALSEPEHLAAS